MTGGPDGVPLFELTDLRRVYTRGNVSVRAVDGVCLRVGVGELLAVEGSSGSGKSTLLAMLGGLERPSSGSIRFEGREMSALTDRDLTNLRAGHIGFIFQGFNLIPTLTAAQNVEAVMAPLRLPASEQKARARELLERVGLGARTDHLPSAMSGGEQQRVAIARAIANNPRVVLADEPTGNLDSATADGVMTLLRGLAADLGVTIVLVTHDRALALQAPRRIRMIDGRIVGGPISVVSPAVPPLPAPVTVRAASWVGRAAAVVAIAGVGVIAVHSAGRENGAVSRFADSLRPIAEATERGQGPGSISDPDPHFAARRHLATTPETPPAPAELSAVVSPHSKRMPNPPLMPTQPAEVAPLAAAVPVVLAPTLSGLTTIPAVAKSGQKPKPRPVVSPVPLPVVAPTPVPLTNPIWPFANSVWWWPTYPAPAPSGP